MQMLQENTALYNAPNDSASTWSRTGAACSCSANLQQMEQELQLSGPPAAANCQRQDQLSG